MGSFGRKDYPLPHDANPSPPIGEWWWPGVGADDWKRILLLDSLGVPMETIRAEFPSTRNMPRVMIPRPGMPRDDSDDSPGLPPRNDRPAPKELEAYRDIHLPKEFVKVNQTKLGQGGYGIVRKGDLTEAYLLANPKYDGPTQVAVKVINSSSTSIDVMKVLLKEIEWWSRLQHQHLLGLIGYCYIPEENAALIVTPYISGGNVKDYLQGQNNILLVDRLKMVLQSLQAIAYLHQKKLYHGDIKSLNILVTDSGDIRLCDFGLTRTIEEAAAHITTGGLGTIRYCSPEILESNGAARGLPGDIWAWGCVAMEIVMKPTTVPYHRCKTEKALQVEMFISQGPPYLPSDFPQAIDIQSVVEACWEWDPKERPAIERCCENFIKMFSKAALESGQFTSEERVRVHDILGAACEDFIVHPFAGCVSACADFVVAYGHNVSDLSS